jgi:hypothetical protein
MDPIWPLPTDKKPGDPGLTDDINQLATNINELNTRTPDASIPDGTVAGLIADDASQTRAALDDYTAGLGSGGSGTATWDTITGKPTTPPSARPAATRPSAARRRSRLLRSCPTTPSRSPR